MGWFAGLAGALSGSRGFRNHFFARSLVRAPAQSSLDTAQLSVRADLDSYVRADGGRGLAGLA